MRLNIIRALCSQTRPRPSKDFFGIADLTTKDVSGIASATKLSVEATATKYEPLSQQRDRLENEETTIDRGFGQIRFDQDNKPRVHGQYQPGNTNILYSTIDIKQKYVPDKSSEIDTVVEVKKGRISKVLRTSSRQFDDEGLKLKGTMIRTSDLEKTINETSQAVDKKPILEYKPEDDKLPLHELEPLTDEYRERYMEEMEEFEFNKELDKKCEVKKEVNRPKAFDYLKDVRANRIEPTAKGLKHRLEHREDTYNSDIRSEITQDSQGFNIYTNQVPNWSRWTRDDLLELIRKSIIYNNYDVLAVNKPYGIATHEQNKKLEIIDMKQLVTEVAASLKIEKVHLCHRLDKSTTGVLLFATSLERAQHIAKAFKAETIKKTYLCITAGVPNPQAAIIDIPIGIFSVSGKVRSCLVPASYDKEVQLSKKFLEARRAVTEYHVLAEEKGAALVEASPRSGVKHQIRCHLSFGIEKPILGDHKYSHTGKLAPQVLPPSMLKALRVRPSKTRTIPLHLHSKRAVIPGAKVNGENLFIDAPVPDFFHHNLKALGLLKDDEVKKMVVRQ